MSVNLEEKQKSIDPILFEKLKKTLERSFLKRDKTSFNTSSVSITNNNKYFSGLMESRTHILDIPSEHGTIVIAISNKDPHVKQIITLVDGEFDLNPLVIKLLCDHVKRTGTNISYSVFNLEGKNIFHCEDVMNLFYKPEIKVLEKIKSWQPRNNFVHVDNSKDIDEQLRECALKGTETHFSAGTKSLYGASVLAGNKIYFGGVHSSFDKRLSLHSEMVAVLSAIMDGNDKISKIGLISTKFVEDLPTVCGCCRQFLSEIQIKLGLDINISCFSFDGKKKLNTSLNEQLPNAWHSK